MNVVTLSWHSVSCKTSGYIGNDVNVRVSYGIWAMYGRLQPYNSASTQLNAMVGVYFCCCGLSHGPACVHTIYWREANMTAGPLKVSGYLFGPKITEATRHKIKKSY